MFPLRSTLARHGRSSGRTKLAGRSCTRHLALFRPTGAKLDAPVKGTQNEDYTRENHNKERPTLSAREAPGLLRPVLFTIGVGLFTFAGASYLTRSEKQDLLRISGKEAGSTGELWNIRKSLEVQWAQNRLKLLEQSAVPAVILHYYAWLEEKWVNMGDGERVSIGLIAMNGLVFLAWQVPHPAVRSYMGRHFMHYPLSGRSYTLLTSVFSHKNFFHFGLNMMAMQSFLRECSWYIGSRQAYDPEFDGIVGDDPFVMINPSSAYNVLAFVLTAGVFAGLGSHLAAAGKIMRAKNTITLQAVRESILPSLGASGAVYGAISLTALAVPGNAIYLIFLPMVPISIGWGTLGLVTMDSVGIIRGWRVLDHWAHLSGAAFGAGYFYGGPYIWGKGDGLLPVPKAGSGSLRG